MQGASEHYLPCPSRAGRRSWRGGRGCFLEKHISCCLKEAICTSTKLTDLGITAAAGLAAEVVKPCNLVE